MKNARRILGIVALAALVFGGARLAGWIAQRRAVVTVQRQLIQDVAQLDGHAYYDFQLLDANTPGERLVDSDDPDIDRHPLAGLCGEDWFHDIVYVTFAQVDGVPEDRRVTVRGEIGDAQILPLLQLPRLQWLAVSGTAISDAAVAQIARQSSLQRLWLSRTQIGDPALNSLLQCPTLTHLALEGTPTSDVGLTSLSQLPSLRFLSLGSPYVTADGLRRLGQTRTLEELHLDRLPVDAAVTKQLAQLTQLRVLSLRMTPLTDEAMAALHPLQLLQEVHLDGTLLGDAALATAAQWKQLKILSVAYTSITDVGLQELAACTQLQRLDVKQTSVSLAGLHKLFVQQQQRTWTDGLQCVFTTRASEAGQLISLDLSPVRLSDSDVGYLLPLTELQWLTMSNSRLTDAGIQTLLQADWKQLSLLRLDNADISDVSLERLAQLPALRTLHIANTHVSPAAVAKLTARKPGLRVYTEQFADKKLK